MNLIFSSLNRTESDVSKLEMNPAYSNQDINTDTKMDCSLI